MSTEPTPELAQRRFLAAQAEMQKLNTMYSDTTEPGTTFLLQGPSGTGKTVTAASAPKPIHFDSFDPRGTESIQKEIKAGGIFVDRRFEQPDDPTNPQIFALWDKEFSRRLQSGYFNHIGTYVLDSGSTFADAAMAVVLKKAGRPGGTPFQQDYPQQMTLVYGALRLITRLPCNVVVTCHTDIVKDEILGSLLVRPAFTGKLKDKIPLLFSEIYLTVAKDTSKGTQYALRTRATGQYTARTRIGREVFEEYEVPNLQELLKKAGKPFENKEY